MAKRIIIGIIVSIVIILGFVLIPNRQENPKRILLDTQQQPTPIEDQTVDRKASFAIFTNGTFRVFTASMYHNLSEDVFIQADNPNLVHVKKAGVTWNDFFSTLPFKLTTDCLITGTNETFCTGNRGTLKFYLNSERTENVLDQEIQNGDRLLVSFGTESEATLKQQLDKIPK